MLTEVRQTDTHAVYFTVRGKGGAPVDLTDTTAVGIAKKMGSPPVSLAVTVYGNPADGVLVHMLTGTLAPGSYSIYTSLTREGIQTTAPTDDENVDCLKVNPLPVLEAVS